ncbi:pentapeptide repeat-containing protein [Streptomyces sp. NPDC048243]|uniref:pentapeptide repeat-containing protein n=1 Tax=Streptomyces sp. NPDC048243 TaxID=3365522 RepID=UPI0037127E1A
MLRRLLRATSEGSSTAQVGFAQFDECIFEGPCDFSDTTFETYPSFNNCRFLGSANFDGVNFQHGCMFGASEFGSVSFVRTDFGTTAYFKRCTFSGPADFTESRFRGAAYFSESKFNAPCTVTAVFEDVASFGRIQSSKGIDFSHATFGGLTSFTRAKLSGKASFDEAQFSRQARFDGLSSSGTLSAYSANFRGECIFSGATFEDAHFQLTVFAGRANFENCTFSEQANFSGCTFQRDFNLKGSTFAKSKTLGPLVCEKTLNLSLTKFSEPWIFLGAAEKIDLRRARWDSISSLRIATGSVDLSDAVLVQPFSITKAAWTASPSGVPDPRVNLTSLVGVDCSFLSMSDIDLSRCIFVGAKNLDQLRLEGLQKFNAPPVEHLWRAGLPFKWTQRQVIEEERQWRTLPNRPTHLRRGWGETPSDHQSVPGLASLTIVYRQLRKAREDAKDEPGAADFYYGEMEMRRHGHKWKEAERWLLQAYWLLSGYGLRASRALGWLSFAMLTTILLMMGFGLPHESSTQEATGTLPAGGGKVTFEIDQMDPENPRGDRFTGERLDKSISVTLNSVVFRSSGQDLTTAGGYIEMASRFSEPVLLGLAALAIRGRVKR